MGRCATSVSWSQGVTGQDAKIYSTGLFGFMRRGIPRGVGVGVGVGFGVGVGVGAGLVSRALGAF